MMMIMMMMMINLRVCGENSRCPWKTARSKALLVVKTELSLLRSAWPPAESTVTLKITHAEAWNFFCAVFHLTISDYSSHQKIDAQDEVDSWENSIFSRKRRTKDCFLLTHNLKSKKVSVRDKFLPDAQFALPLWNVAPALLKFHRQLASLNHHNITFCTTDIFEFLNSYHRILWY